MTRDPLMLNLRLLDVATTRNPLMLVWGAESCQGAALVI